MNLIHVFFSFGMIMIAQMAYSKASNRYSAGVGGPHIPPKSPNLHSPLMENHQEKQGQYQPNISQACLRSLDSNFRFSKFSTERGSDDPRSRCIWATYCHRLGHWDDRPALQRIHKPWLIQLVRQ